MANLGQLQQIDDYIKSPLPQLGEMKATPTVQSKPKLAEYPAYNELQQARASEQSNGLGDYVRTFGAAVPKVGAGVVEIANKVGLVSDETRNEIQKGADRSSQALYSKMVPSFVKSATQPLFKDDPEDKLKWYQQFNPDYDTTTLLHDLTASTPGIIAMGAGGAGVGKASTKILSPILERLGIGETVASHFPSLAKMAETAFPGEATAAAKVNKLIAHQVGMRGGQVASEGLLTASQGASDKRQEALNTPLETYRKNPLFQGIVNGQDLNLPLDQREEKARAELAERAADHVFTSTFQSTAGIAALTGGGALGDIAARTGKVTSALHKAMLKEGFKEGIAQELPQSYNEQLISNIATKKFIDPDKDVLEGTIDAALKGGITGVAMGSGMAVGSHPFLDNKQAKEQGQVNPLTGTSWTSKEVEKNYTLYNQLVSNNTDPTTPEYNSAYSSITSALKKVINPGEGKEQADPNALREAETALNIIEKAHKVKLSNFDTESQAVNIADEELKPIEQPKKEVTNEKPDSSPVQVTNPPIEDSKPPVPPEAVISKEVEQDDMSTADLESIKIGELTLKSKQRMVAEGLATVEEVNLDVPDIQNTQETSEIQIEDAIDEQPIDQTDTTELPTTPDPIYTGDSIPANQVEGRTSENERFRQSIAKLEKDVSDLTRANQYKDEAINLYRSKEKIDPKTGIRSYSAYKSDPSKSLQVSIDADSLKWINDNLGHKEGDQLLAYIGQAMAQVAPEDSYHVSGDEFILQAGSIKEATERMKAVEKILETVSFGNDKHTINGIGISYGIAGKLDVADKKLQDHKNKREQEGKRAARGAQPFNISNNAETASSSQSQAAQAEPTSQVIQPVVSKSKVAPKLDLKAFKQGLEEPVVQETKIEPIVEITAPTSIKEKNSNKKEIESLESQISDKISKLQAIADKTKNGEEIDWSKDWEEGSPIASMEHGRLNAAAHEITQLQAKVQELKDVNQVIKPKATKVARAKKEAVTKEPVKVYSPGDIVSVNLPATYQYRDTKKQHAIPSKMRGKDITVEIVSPIYKGDKVTDYNVILRTTTSVGKPDDYKVRLGVKEIGELVGTTGQVVQESTAPVVQETKVEPVKATPVTSQGDAESLSRDYLDAIDAEDRKLASEIKVRLQEEFGITSPSKYLKDLKAGKVIEEAGDLSLADKTILRESTEFDEEEADENYKQEVDRTIETDEDQFSFNDDLEIEEDTSPKPATLLIFEDLVNNYLSQSIKDTVDFKYIPNFSTYNWVGEEGVGLESLHAFQGGGGVVRTSKATGKKTVFINGANSSKSFVGVFIHEVVGHVGLRKLFNAHYKLNRRQIAYNSTSDRPLDAYDNFLVNLLSADKELVSKIFGKYASWPFYVDQWAINKGAFKVDPKTGKKIVDTDKYNQLINKLPAKFKLTVNLKNTKGQNVTRTLPADVAARYADEYMADLAKELFFKDTFLANNIGLTEAEREAKRESNLKGFKKFLMKVRHFLRAVFGKYSLDVKNADLVRMIALSHDSVFAKPIYKDSPVRSFKFDNTTTYVPKIEVVGNTTSSGIQSDAFSPGNAVDPDTQLEDKFLNDPFVNPQYIQDIKSFVKMEQLASNEAVGKSVSSRLTKQFNDRIDASAFLSSFKALGNLTAPDLYNMISNVYKGAIGNIEAKSLHIAKIFDKLDPIQNEAAFKYMTTKGADINDVAITDLQKRYLVKAKEDIRKLGQLQVDAGLLSQDVFNKFEDSYLHRIYMEHIKDYRGSGKRTSFMSHLQHRKNKSEAERIALGEIKDIRFLLADTLGTIGRDTVLLQLFDTLKKGSLDGGIHWVLTSNEKVKWFRKKLTIDQAMEQIERNEELIRWYAEDTARKAHYVVNNTPEVDRRYNLTFFATPEQQAELVARNDLLKQAVDEVEHKALADAFNKASSTKVTTSKDKAEFLENHYVRMPNDKRFGALRSQYVRKEIANDLDAFVSPYDMREKSTLEKILAPGGTLERLNAFWKLSMVGLNPASWVRNAVGNFVLLDLSTRTNKATLMGWLFDEVRGYLRGEPSKYWKYSFDLGLFGTTFSANEMQSYFRQYGNSLEESMAKHKALTQTPLDKSLFFLDNRFLGIMQLGKAFATDAKNRVEGKTSHWFSMLEGSFKAVALRDYVTTWEKENGKLIEDLPETERLFVLSKAANHANNNLFDYSQTNSFVKYARRVPMGSPFLTYSYKAFPVAVKSAVQNPIKFLEYATLPALVTQLAMLMNDWDDKDIDKMKRSLNDYQRTNPFITFIPFKDENGKPQVQDLSYLMPWSQTATAGRKIYENYVEDGGVSPVSTTIKSIAAIPSDFGFMGGPLPSVIAAAQSGENGFTGRSIATKGASADQQMMDYMRFGWDMAVPSWVSSHGWLTKLYTEFTTGRGELDRFGDVRYTPSQIATEALGFNTKTVNVKTGLANRQKGYEYRLKELATYRSSVLKDKNRNNVEKLSELRDITFREKLLRKQMQEATAN